MIKYIENHLDKIIGATIVLAIFGWLLTFNPWGIFEGLRMICNFNEMILVIIWLIKVFNIFFIDHYGKFNWIGITSILAIATLTFNAWDRRRQFKADLISQSRITWIENVRKATAKYLGTLYAYKKTSHDIEMVLSKRKAGATTSKEEDNLDKLWIKQDDLALDLFETTEQVALYFNKNDEEILTLIREPPKKLTEYQRQFNQKYLGMEKSKNNNERMRAWNELLDFSIKNNKDVDVVRIESKISDYLKTEWEKAKTGN